MSAVSLMACLLRLLRWNRESSCCCCPSVSGQAERMHYLKSLPLALLPFTQSHKRPKVTGTMETRRSSIPPAHTSNPIKNTHKQTNTQLPLTYHHCPRTLHTRKAARLQTRTPSCFCSQPSLNSIPCILQLACHSSPQCYQSLSPRPHNGSSWVASAAPAISKF